MAEKNLPPSHRRLREARKRGEAAVSAEIDTAAGLLAVLATLWLGREAVLREAGRLIDLLVAAAATPAPTARDTDAAWTAALLAFARLCGPLLGAAVAAPLLAGFLQTRGMVSFKPMNPDFSRLNPGKFFQNIFSSRQMLTLGKLLLKTVALSCALYATLRASLPLLLETPQAPRQSSFAIAQGLFLELLFGAALLFLPFAALDVAHQLYEFVKRHRMSIEEVRHEHKDDEGDPHLKAHRRGTAREMATRPVEAVDSANVVVVNPTHFAVALRYERGRTPLPIVVAKGVDARALAMRQRAQSRGIPVVEDRVLARRLHATVPLGHYIGDALLEPVALVFRRLVAPQAAPLGARPGAVRGVR